MQAEIPLDNSGAQFLVANAAMMPSTGDRAMQKTELRPVSQNRQDRGRIGVYRRCSNSSERRPFGVSR